jgi:multidrug efflux system membrane fusion protein
VTGRTRATLDISLRAEAQGRIVALYHDEGDFVEKGTVIAEIDPKDINERVQEAEKLLSQREIEFKATKSLENRGFNSRIALAEAQTELDQAKTALKTAQTALANTKIIAPHKGVITDNHIEVGDFVQFGDPLLTLIDLNPIEIVGFVSEQNVKDITINTTAHLNVLNRQDIKGRIVYISPKANEQARTFEIHIQANNDDGFFVDGMTAQINVPLSSRKAYKISPSVLTLNDAGEVGVKLVDDNNIVRFAPVKILKDNPNHMWVSGLPQKIRLITLGQDFVRDGVEVRPTLAGDDGLL